MKLNLGSHRDPLWGWVNVDIHPYDGVDILYDLNVIPWPWKDESVDEIRAVAILEHLGKRTKWELVEEMARITKPAGKVLVEVPICTKVSALASLQHAHSFYYTSFDNNYAQPWFALVGLQVKVRLFGFTTYVWWTRWTRILLKPACRLGFARALRFHLEKL